MNLRRAAVPVAAAAMLALAPAVLAGHAFTASTTTAGGYHTWDSDLIDTELVAETGAGVYVAVLDTGLVPNWPDYFPDDRVAQELGAGFYQNVTFKAHSADGCELDTEIGPLKRVSYLGSRGSSHGTHVASTIIGYNYRSNFDMAEGFSLPAIQVRGIAPNATIIPVRVLADYQVPALPRCDEPTPSGLAVFGTSEMVAAGIDYVTGLKQGVLADHPVVINMSLGGDPDEEIADVERVAIDKAIAAGVIVVAAAGNDGEDGMSAPGSYAPVISAGALGWTGEWLDQETDPEGPDNEFRYRMWWLKNVAGNGAGSAGSLQPPLNAGSGDVAEGDASKIYVTDFSSREHDALGQDLDVLAPGSWVRGPFAGTPGFNHLPWWSKGFGDFFNNSGNFFYVGGTSMASPHVASVVALMLEKNPDLTAAQAEAILESSAMDFGAGSAMVWDPFHVDADGNALPAFVEFTWNADAVGEGVLQADAAVAATP